MGAPEAETIRRKPGSLLAELTPGGRVAWIEWSRRGGRAKTCPHNLDEMGLTLTGACVPPFHPDPRVIFSYTVRSLVHVAPSTGTEAGSPSRWLCSERAGVPLRQR